VAKAACRILQIESGEILAEYRPALTDAGAIGHEAEIFVYDTLAGGAGFSPQLAAKVNAFSGRRFRSSRSVRLRAIHPVIAVCEAIATKSSIGFLTGNSANSFCGTRFLEDIRSIPQIASRRHSRCCMLTSSGIFPKPSTWIATCADEPSPAK
jgi:hypothetical protein